MKRTQQVITYVFRYEIGFSLKNSGFSYLYGSISYLFGYEKNRCFFLMLSAEELHALSRMWESQVPFTRLDSTRWPVPSFATLRNVLEMVYCLHMMMRCLLFVLAETKISPKIYTPRVFPTIRGCLEGLALMI
jgi:hypothetical protein